jgi:hypothetical protein
MSEEDSRVSKNEEESATVVAGGKKSEVDQLSTVLGVADKGVNEGSSVKESFKRIDLRDLEAATVMILNVLPDLKDYEVGIAMNVMIRGFHGGTSTAWVPLNRKVVDLLRMLTSEDRIAGVGTFLLLLKGVNMATDEYSKATRKIQIENSLQSARREQKSREEAEKLHLALEEERKKSLELIAAMSKGDSTLASARRANLQLVTEAEKKQEQIDSLSGTVSGHSNTLSGLRQQVKNQSDVITQYKSCEVMHEDGSAGQAVASRAELANMSSKV